MRLSEFVPVNGPDREAILVAIKRAKSKGLVEAPVLLPSCGRVVVLRRGIAAGVECFEADRWSESSEGGA